MLRLPGSGIHGAVAVGKIGYAAACLASAVVLVAAGYAHNVVGYVNDISDGASIGDSPSVGAMNILVMGLESRTNFQGQYLTAQQLTETHSGKESNVEDTGSQDTDTLILIHVFAGGQKAVGFSIPRDDLVNYPHATLDGLTEGKIDAAYYYAYVQSLDQTSGESMSSDERYLLANQAGQLFEVQTVESVTGVHIDHFVESNIIGFYYLAKEFGGLEVCIKPAPAQGGFAAGANLTDFDPQTGLNNSGFNAYNDGYNAKKGGAQYLHLSAAQSLAYVRARDTLPGVDIGRTARQQAALDYVIYALKHENYFGDITKLTDLLGGASQYLIADKNFDLLDFATDMKAFSGKNLSFTTLPAAPVNNVTVPGYPTPQDVNYIHVPAIQREVNSAFYGATATTRPASSVTVDVYNGSGAPGLAGDVSQALGALGYKTGKAENSSAQSQTVADDTQVFYGAGAEVNAEGIANDMGTTTATALSSLPAGHVEVLLGSAVTALPPGLVTYGAATVSAQDYASAVATDGPASAGTQSVSAAKLGARASAASAAAKSAPKPAKSASPASGDQSVTVAPNAKYGIPCVY
jgi:anionic cell wall polymer biosynthesis LytR-Cps2A-Psr (LCP) family protein